MTEFKAYDAVTHPIVKLVDDWNNLLGHGLITPVKYIVYNDGVTNYCKDGNTGKIYVSGANATTVIQAALYGLTPGRSSVETVVVKGNYTVGLLIIQSYTKLILDGKLTLSTGANSMLLDTAGGHDIEITGGIYNGNKAGQGAGAFYCINVADGYNVFIHEVNTINGFIDNLAVLNSHGVIINNVLSSGSNNVDLITDANCYGVVINGAYCTSQTALEVHGSYSSYSNIVSYSPASYCFAVIEGTGNALENLVSYDADGGILVDTGARDTHISNCIIKCNVNASAGIIMRSDGVIEGCLFEGKGKANSVGISLQYNNTIVNGNRIKNWADAGIYFANDYCVASNNRIYDDQTPKTQIQPIIIAATADYNTIQNNSMVGNLSNIILIAGGTGNIIRGNTGHITESSGNGAIAAAATSEVINHGCNYTPNASDVTVTPIVATTTDFGYIWVDTFTSTQMTIHCAAVPGVSTLPYYWSIRKTP